MATQWRTGSSAKKLTYRPAAHDDYMLELKWILRKESRFAEEIVNGEHMCPGGASGTPSIAYDADGDAQEFQLPRLTRSPHPHKRQPIADESSDTEDDQQMPDELDEDELSEVMELHLQQLVRMAYEEGKEAADNPVGRTRTPSSQPSKASEGSGGSHGERPAATAETKAEEKELETKTKTPSQMTTISSGRDASTLEAGAAVDSPGAAVHSDPEISLQMTPQDQPQVRDPQRRGNLAPRWSTIGDLMKGLSGISARSKRPDGASKREHPGGRPASAVPLGSKTLPSPTKRPSQPVTLPEDNISQASEALRRAVLSWMARRRLRKRLGRDFGHRKTKKSTSSRANDKSYLNRIKLISTYSRNGMPDSDFRQLSHAMQVAVWEHASEVIYMTIRGSLGIKYRYIISRVAEGDGVGCYRALHRVGNEQTASAKSMFLTKLMNLKLQQTGTRDTPACMQTYFTELQDLNEKYRKANPDGIGVHADILRAKLLELPAQYSLVQTLLEQADADARRLGQRPRSCQEICDYVVAWETKQRRLRSGRRIHKAHKARDMGRPPRSRRARQTRSEFEPDRALWATKRDPKKKGPHRPGQNPNRHHRGRGGRIAMRRGRGGGSRRGDGHNGKGVECWNCGQTGHFKRDCPHGSDQRNNGGRAFRARTAHSATAARGPRNYASFLLREVKEEKKEGADVAARALHAGRGPALLLDSGSTGHFTKPSIELQNVRPTSKTIQGAGPGDTMRAEVQGDLGSLKDVLQVEGLQQSLLSVSKLTYEHDACIIFTMDSAYMLPFRRVASLLAEAGRPIAKCDDAGLYVTYVERLERGINRVRKRPPSKRALAMNGSATGGSQVGDARGNVSTSAPSLGKACRARPAQARYERGDIRRYFRPSSRSKREKPRTRAASEDSLNAVEEQETMQTKRQKVNTEPCVLNRRRLSNEEQQVLVLATSGDMALAAIVADSTGVDMKAIRGEMKQSKAHWAHRAAEYTLMTCVECGRPGWPDCECPLVPRGTVHPPTPHHAYNYMDKPAPNPATLFHKRLGHLPVARMLQVFKGGCNHGIPGLTERAIREMPWCEDCAACKSTRKGHPQIAKGRRRSSTINAVIHTDGMERAVPSLAPERFTRIQVFVDEATRYLWLSFYRNKSTADFMKMLEEFESRAQVQHRHSVQWKQDAGTPVLSYFSDNEGALVAPQQRERLAKKLIELRTSVPHESQANGIAERMNRTVIETTRVLLRQAGLPLPFWKLAAEMSAWLINRSPTKALSGNRSPFEAYYGRKPDLSNLRTFGCKCWVWIPKEKREAQSKIAPSARAMLFVGYNEEGTRGFKVWDPITKVVKIRYSLLFEEDAKLGFGVSPNRNVAVLEDDGQGDREISEDRPLAIEQDIATESEGKESDGWNQLYTMADEETFEDVGLKLGVSPEEIQKRNEGVAGCNPRTKLAPIDAPMQEGTQIWVPSGRETGKEGQREDTAVERAEISVGPEAESKASEDMAWRGRLRSRTRQQGRAHTMDHINKATLIEAVGALPNDRIPAEYVLIAERMLKQSDCVESIRTMVDSLERKRRAKMKAGRGGKARRSGWYANMAKSAARHGRTQTLTWLINNRQVNPNTTSESKGHSLLHLAAFYGHQDTCRCLLKKGASTSKRNCRGEYAWEAAQAGGHPECASLIRQWEKRDRRSGIRPPWVSAEHNTYYEPITISPGDGEQGTSVIAAGLEPPSNLDRPRPLSTDRLLRGILTRAKQVARTQEARHRGGSTKTGRKRAANFSCKDYADEQCKLARDDFVKAYTIERAYLIESLRGVKSIPTPQNYNEAIHSDFAEYWNEAILTELRNLEAHSTWEIIPRSTLPPGTKLVDSKWAFRVKRNQAGEVDRMKARLCARGFREIWGIHYVETHAPVTCLVSWRTCMALAAARGRGVAVLDIKSAYLMADLTETVYMSVPQGLKAPEGTVLRLKKSIYGLKQSGRRWNERLHEVLTKMGMRRSKADPCLYLRGQGQHALTVNVHVDDCCITYTKEQHYERFKGELEKTFELSTSDDKNVFLGMVIERLEPEKFGNRGPIYIHQGPYVEEILARYRHLDCKYASTPMDPGLKLSKAQMPTTEEEKRKMASYPYKQLVGALLYLASCTRPDLAYSVGVCARFGSNPGMVHWQALKHTLRYLAGTRKLGLVYNHQPAEGVPQNCMHGYVDGDWGGDPDTRRSTSGYIYMSYGGPVSWSSKRQSSVSLSSCESEYYAAAEAAKESVWLIRLLQDLGINDVSLETKGDLSEKEYMGEKPMTIFEDNVGCIHLSKNPVAHKSSKHIEIRYHFVRERVRDGTIKLVYIPSSENLADICTKSTRKGVFVYLRDKMMMAPHPDKSGTKTHSQR